MRSIITLNIQGFLPKNENSGGIVGSHVKLVRACVLQNAVGVRVLSVIKLHVV
jgi:hypothetical protein